MSLSSQFNYQALAGDEIRVIKIKKDGGDPHIHCSLEHVSLGAQPQFAALSYVWGDPTDVVPIFVNGAECNITTNLCACLRRIQQLFASEETKLGDLDEQSFWIDAICINQSDNVEKSIQVPRMRDIYSSSKEVLGWLGENGDKEDFTLMAIFEMGKQLAKAFERNPALFIQDTKQTPLGKREIFQKMAALDPYGSDRMAWYTIVLGRLFERPWFSRVWIIQEAVLASKRLVLIAGAHWVPVTVLEWFLRVWESTASLTTMSEFFNYIQRSYRLSSIRVEFQTREAPTDLAAFAKYFQWLVSRTFSYKSTVPHDLIYGRLGLCGGGTVLSTHLAPNYSLPYADVFHQYAMLCFRHTGSLALLMTEQHHLTGVPSWVPDFRYMMNATSLETATCDLQPSTDGKVLAVEGTRIGDIEFISEIVSCSPEQPDTVRDAIRSFDRGIVRKSSEKMGISSKQVIHELWAPIWGSSQLGAGKESLEGLQNCYQYLLDFDGPIDVDNSPFPRFAFHVALLSGYMNRNPFVTSDGIPGISLRVDARLAKGDVICLIKGLPSAAPLRPHLGDYLYLGPCGLGGNHLDQVYDDGAFLGHQEIWKLV